MPPFPTGTVVVDYSLQLFCSTIKISMVVSALTPSLLCEDSGWRTLHFQTQSVGDLYMCMTSCGVSVILNKEMGGINKVCYLNSALLLSLLHRVLLGCKVLKSDGIYSALDDGSVPISWLIITDPLSLLVCL